MKGILQDVRYGLRMLRNSPGFTAVAIATLALGIGASTVVFSILDTLYLRPAPVPAGDQLVSGQLTERNISPSELFFHREHNSSFSGVAAEWPTSHKYLGSADNPKMVLASLVTANYFDVLRVHPAAGRFFVGEDDQRGRGTAVAVLSDHLWRSEFAGDPNVVSKTIKLNGNTVAVVGVAPPWFHGILAGVDEDLWLPTATAAAMDPNCAKQKRCDIFVMFVARLKPDRAIGTAQEEMNVLNQQWEAIHPELEKSSVELYRVRGVHPGWRAGFSPLPKLLLCAVALLLSIVCANVAGLLLARGTSRSKEIAVRLALGAGRGRIVRQLLTEASLLAVGGCALGLLLLRASQDWLSHFPFRGSEGFPSYYDVSLNRSVLFATIAVSTLAVFAFGLVPALRASRPAPMLALKNIEGSAGQSARLRGMLVVAQVALASTLGCSALLIVRSLNHVLEGQGFDPSHVAFIRVTPGNLGYAPQKSAGIQEEALRRLAAVPGVQSVSFAQLLPWWESHDATVSLPGSNVPDLRLGIHATYNTIAPNFLATLQIPLLQGRDFSDSDQKNSPKAAIVNQSLANRMWPGQAAIGRTLMINANEHTVVGVVQDAQYNPASDLPHLAFYLPYWQYRDGGDARFFIRTMANPGPMLRQLKLTIRGIDPNVPVGEDATMVEALLSDFGPLRLTRAVLVFTGAVALFLSTIGLYSVLAFLVVRRTREIGIRMALGATRQGILGVFLKQGMRLALAGALAGSIAALASTRLLSNFLYGVSPQDPEVLIVVAFFLVIACSLASYIPARRATKVDPIVALRYE